ncbi:MULTISPECIES: helix-turn-helix domain-containing protein [Providencia]|uniref:helix-turn-helix domain-containing protein n=1 Tax=Providencia TaxID=586 RepID=UPI00201E4210|nr:MULTISPECIES: helix-turn-helix transcriptional regulator [Providencia]EMA4784615.1 helix-turn-helix transcriptional regulator [Providencia rettgeri]EMB3084628.1 helix-turn-helix transcriptional regulator [Providencia rettgeri]MDU7495978.1 helix-turn-helix transcriptional regulator [Providencia rettgeri]UQZ14159.1 helix-turn-helix domain-containing protein [Providencia stuartii]HEM8139373.1 helix-turn-helix transcriptional regulator [Providencia rettgeri]
MMKNKGYPVSILIGKKIHCIRKEKGITGEKLARMLNISQQQVSRYERGVNKITVDFLFEISEILGVTLFDLLVIDKEELPFEYLCHHVSSSIIKKS